MATQTDNYNLDLYETGDAAALTDQYNSAMRKIDNDLKTFNQGITSASQQAANAKKVADANTATLNALGATDTGTATALKNKIDTTSNTANTNSAKLNALGADNTSNATALKTKIDTTATTANNAKSIADANTAKLNALGADNTSNATALKTKIDTTATTANNAKSIADANTAKLNALGADSTSNATALKNKINTTANTANANTTAIAELTKVVEKIGYQSGIMLTFGDSYSAAENQAYTWTYQLNQFLPQLTWKNYGQSGAGFNVSGLLFIDQITRAANDTSFNNDDVALCVLAGGRNDILDYGNAKTRMQTCIDTLLQKFPNAHIVIAPMLWDSSVLKADNRPKLTGLQDPLNRTAGYTPRLSAINYAYLWLKGSTDLLQPNGNIHPNELGAKTIAQYLLQGAYHRYVPRAEITNTNIGGATGSVSLSGGTCTLDVMGTIDNIGNGQGAQLPGWAASMHNVWVWGVSQGSVTTPQLYSINGTKFEMYNYEGKTGNASVQMTYEA